jgi:hypothetical protein
VCAGNWIEDYGAASLAPSLGRMAQLTSLDLSSTLHASAAAGAVSGCFANAGKCADDIACCGLGQLRAGQERVVGFGRGEPRGGGACRQSDRR